MLFEVEINGIRPIIHPSGVGIDPKHPANVEKPALARITASNRTDRGQHRPGRSGVPNWAANTAESGATLDRARQPVKPAGETVIVAWRG